MFVRAVSLPNLRALSYLLTGIELARLLVCERLRARTLFCFVARAKHSVCLPDDRQASGQMASCDGILIPQVLCASATGFSGLSADQGEKVSVEHGMTSCTCH